MCPDGVVRPGSILPYLQVLIIWQGLISMKISDITAFLSTVLSWNWLMRIYRTHEAKDFGKYVLIKANEEIGPARHGDAFEAYRCWI